MLYPLVRTRLGSEEAVAVYGVNHVATLSEAATTWLFNATGENELTVRTEDGLARRAKVYNCLGEQVAEVELSAVRLQTIDVPMAGFAVIEK